MRRSISLNQSVLTCVVTNDDEMWLINLIKEFFSCCLWRGNWLVHREFLVYHLHWKSIHVSLIWILKLSFVVHYVFQLTFYSMGNDIGEDGATSLSEALEINSSFAQLDLAVSLLLNMFKYSLLNHIPFGTRLEILEQHHYQRHWRLIHPSLNWTWVWVYDWILLIDYYSITFHLEQDWRIRSNIIIRSTEG